jgi:acyl-CoA thioesterase-1
MVMLGLALAGGVEAAAPRTVLIVGDSLSAGYAIPAESAWPVLLAPRLEARHVRLVNASVSGETTAGALARLPALLARERPAIVLVELGANDGLRGLPLAEIRSNLHAIVDSVRKSKARALLLGIELPVNYGPPYREGLRAIYRDLAAEFNVPLVPFLLEGIAQDEALLLSDGLHPTAAAQPRVLDNVWPQLEPLL